MGHLACMQNLSLTFTAHDPCKRKNVSWTFKAQSWSHLALVCFLIPFQVVQIAKEVMGTNDSNLAVSLFRQKLNSTDSFFNDAPIPKNESNKEAHKRCSNLTGAEKYCPKRWAAMQLWFREARRVSMSEKKKN